MEYTLLRWLHLGAVYLTCFLFLLRGVWMLAESPRLRARWVRVLPHLNDTVLLLAALALVWQGGWPVLDSPWLLAKIAGLLAYIVLGSQALKRGRTRARRLGWFLAALAAFGYIVAVAVTKQVLPGVA